MGWNRQNITDWMAMAGAVSALVFNFALGIYKSSAIFLPI